MHGVMKSLAVTFCICLLLKSGRSILEPQSSPSPTVKFTVKQCLIHYDIDPAILEPDIDRDDLYSKLSDVKRGCVTACIYRGFNLLRPDGSLDIDLLTEGDTPEESEAEKTKYVKIVGECRKEVGRDDCKFFHCLDLKS